MSQQPGPWHEPPGQGANIDADAAKLLRWKALVWGVEAQGPPVRPVLAVNGCGSWAIIVAVWFALGIEP